MRPQRAYKDIIIGSDEGRKEVIVLDSCPCGSQFKIKDTDDRIAWTSKAYITLKKDSAEDIICKTEKSLKFTKSAKIPILQGVIDITWRCEDEKNITAGDSIALQNKDGVEFAKADVLWVKNTIMGNLTDEDKKGHEKFKSDKEMFQTYSKYYKKVVNKDTPIKVIKFVVV